VTPDDTATGYHTVTGHFRGPESASAQARIRTVHHIPVMTRTTTTVPVLIAGALIALHLLDDNFIEPGVSGIGNHLMSGLVPLTAVVLLTFLPGVRRAGSRAVGVLALGLLGLTFGSEALRHALTERPVGDDWTGLASLAAGAFLVGLGIRDLWRSRRPDGSRWRRYTRRTAKGFAALLVTLWVVYPVAEAYVFSNSARNEVPEAHLGTAHEEVAFETTDGYLLQGWYVPSENGAAVILYPGRGGTQRHARLLIEHGYGVLLFDPRGVGDSEGDPTGWGWGNELDIEGAVDFLQQRADVDRGRIGGLGLSVGAEVLLHAAAEDYGLRAVVSEGAGARSWYEYRHLEGSTPVVNAPVSINRMLATAVFENRMPPPGLHGLADRIEIPVFFLHATEAIGGESLTEDYYERAAGPKEIWQTDGGHTDAIAEHPAEYERRVIAFFDETLQG
jgi:uncharacterized protein